MSKPLSSHLSYCPRKPLQATPRNIQLKCHPFCLTSDIYIRWNGLCSTRCLLLSLDSKVNLGSLAQVQLCFGQPKLIEMYLIWGAVTFCPAIDDEIHGTMIQIFGSKCSDTQNYLVILLLSPHSIRGFPYLVNLISISMCQGKDMYLN